MFCQNCGNAIQGNFCANCGSKPNNNAAPAQPVMQNGQSYLRCNRCQSHNINIQTLTESKKTSCGMIALYILLACTVCGLLIVIPLLLRKKDETVTYAICQNCGNRWKV